MKITISNNINKPIYEQIAIQIKTMVMNGELHAGDGIPSMRELAKSLHVSVITVQKAYEDLHREGFIETTVGRGSFVSAHDREFYKKEQQRRAEEHLLAAAEIGRMNNISLTELSGLLALYYQQGERRIHMRKLMLQKDSTDGKIVFSVADAASGEIVYALEKTKESILSECFMVWSESGSEVAAVKREHVLFTPAKLPKVTVFMKDGRSFAVKKEMEQLTDVIRVEGEAVTVKGTVFSEQFELLCEDKCIAAYTYKDRKLVFEVDETEELLAVLFAFAVTLAR